MNKLNKLFGYTYSQLLSAIALGIVATFFLGFLPELITVAGTGAVIHYRKYRQNRPGAAWEI